MQLIRKYKNSIITLAFILAIFWAFLQGMNYAKMKSDLKASQLEAETQKAINKDNERTITIKNIQQRIVNKVSGADNADYRIKFLHDVWEEQGGVKE